VTFNDTKAVYPKDKTIIELFEKQVAKTPDHVALVFAGKGLTYQEVHEQSNQLAHYLQKKYDIHPEDLVGIRQDRSEWMIISILAVLKSGGAYVPIDLDYPQDRISYIENDTKCKVCIDEIELKKFKKNRSIYSKESPSILVKPTNLAYVIYTSGSTGKPKGVMIEHGSIVNLITSQTNTFRIREEEKILQFSNYGFDASVEQIFLALCNGASLVLVSKSLLLSTEALAAFINEEKITHLHATPSFLENIRIADCVFLKRVIAGGEVCKKELAERCTGLVDFYNEYGPTETTVTSIEYHIGVKDLKSLNLVPIGKPISNTQVYILSEENELQPKGVIGEICIGGSGVARGYLNQEDLTREKFIENPFKVGERLYKT
ncbi:MAG: amino acid adenylation domain-containing protein, partial [Flavobacterium sp.]